MVEFSSSTSENSTIIDPDIAWIRKYDSHFLIHAISLQHHLSKTPIHLQLLKIPPSLILILHFSYLNCLKLYELFHSAVSQGLQSHFCIGSVMSLHHFLGHWPLYTMS